MPTTMTSLALQRLSEEFGRCVERLVYTTPSESVGFWLVELNRLIKEARANKLTGGEPLTPEQTSNVEAFLNELRADNTEINHREAEENLRGMLARQGVGPELIPILRGEVEPESIRGR